MSQGRNHTKEGFAPRRERQTVLSRKERQRLLQRLQEQTQLLDLAHVLIRDLADRILFWNKGMEQLYGWTQEEAVGQASHALFKTVFPVSQEAFSAALLQQGSWSGELVHTCRDGSKIVVASHQVVHRDAEGKPVAFLEVDNNITGLRQAEADLRISEARLASIIRSAMDAIITADADRKVLLFNEAAERMFGCSAAAAVGRPLERFIPAWFRNDRGKQPFHGDENAGSPVETPIPLMALRAGGEEFPIEATRSHSVVEGQDLYTVIARDITERKRIEAEIRTLNAELERRVSERTTQLQAINSELETFSYSVSHDLRAPLRGIDGFSQALLEDYADALDEQGKDYLQRIRARTLQMAALIDDLLSLSRVSRRDLQKSSVDLSALAAGIAKDLQESGPERRATFRIAEGIVACADPALIQIVLTNLLDNAWKFTARHSQAHIEFGVVDQNGERVYFVRDDGAGFDAKYAEKLFGAFQRLHTTEEFAGTGIGLATVQRIVHRHGGRIWAEGAVEQGAAFYFTL